MKREEVWENIKNDKSTVYGETMLDMFLKTTRYLHEDDWEEIKEGKRKIVNPNIRLVYARNSREAEDAIRDGAHDVEWGLRIAAQEGNVEACKRIVKLGARDFRDAIMLAVPEGHLDVCKWAIENVDEQDRKRYLSLAMGNAAHLGHLHICKWAAENGADRFGRALSSAAAGGHLDVCKWAFEKGARKNKEDIEDAIEDAIKATKDSFRLESQEIHDFLIAAREKLK